MESQRLVYKVCAEAQDMAQRVRAVKHRLWKTCTRRALAAITHPPCRLLALH
jgi:hypothetical protein